MISDWWIRGAAAAEATKLLDISAGLLGVRFPRKHGRFYLKKVKKNDGLVFVCSVCAQSTLCPPRVWYSA